ncbi:MAG TPA: hypothetical protein VFE30_04055 [Anaeromyxobacteraceae bacterium]|nr:hypothetical protein [Anaeromyxobacteraceae bacterium]
MRHVLAIALAVLVAVSAAAPHAHAGAFGDHACAACLAASAERAESATPDVAPRALPPEALPREPGLAPVCGAPLGAVPGQSPPAA